MPPRRLLRPRKLDAGVFGADVASFRLHLAAENKAERTIRAYTEAVRWFAAAHLLCQTSKARWEQVDKQDVQRWMVHLLGHYSEAYAYQQYRALQQFFRWLAAEDELPDPMARLRPPRVTEKPVPFFTSVELSELEKACRGSTFAQRRDAAILAVFKATGIRLPRWPGSATTRTTLTSDLDLDSRQIRIREGRQGANRQNRLQGARRVDRYLRIRPGHAQACRSRLWLGVNGRDPLTANGINEMVKRRGKQCGVQVYPHRFRHDFSHTSLTAAARKGLDGAERLELAADAHPLRRQRPRRTRPPYLRPDHVRQPLNPGVAASSEDGSPATERGNVASGMPAQHLLRPARFLSRGSCSVCVVRSGPCAAVTLGLRMVRAGGEKDNDRTPTAFRAAQAAGCREVPGRDRLVPAARAAEGKAAKTVRTYTEAVQWWFAASYLLETTGRTGWEQVSGQDVQEWMVRLLDRYSSAYASNQYRGLQQFFKWLAAEEGMPDPMTGLQPPHVTQNLVPVFTDGELSRLEHACAGRAFVPAPRCRHHRGVQGDRHTAGRAGQHPVRPQRPAAQRCRRVAAGDHCPRQGRQDPDRQDQLRSRPQPRPVSAGPGPACAGERAAAVARDGQSGAPDRQRDLPDAARRGSAVRRGRFPAPVPAHFSHTWLDLRSGGGPDGAERLDLPADAAPLRRQRP